MVRNHTSIYPTTSATAPCVALGGCSRRRSTSIVLAVAPPASVQSSYRFLALEKTVQEIAEKKRANQPLVPEKKAVADEQAQ